MSIRTQDIKAHQGSRSPMVQHVTCCISSSTVKTMLTVSVAWLCERNKFLILRIGQSEGKTECLQGSWVFEFPTFNMICPPSWISWMHLSKISIFIKNHQWTPCFLARSTMPPSFKCIFFPSIWLLYHHYVARHVDEIFVLLLSIFSLMLQRDKDRIVWFIIQGCCCH